MSGSSLNSSDSIISERWYWLDWLRVLAMVTIFLYHSGRPFVVFEWHIMDAEPDMVFTLVNIFVTGWIMPLFFVISGMATYFSLARRSPRQFAISRIKRLVIPFIFALFVIIPAHAYFEALFNGFTGSFLDFYFNWYFIIRGQFGGVFPFDFYLRPTYFAGADQGIYLWYLFWLFVYSLVTAHFFRWLRSEENRSRISKLAAVSNRLGGIFLLAIPLVITDIVALPPFFVFPSGYGGWKLPSYLVFYILAYVLASDPQFKQSIAKNGVPALVIGIVTSILIIVFATVIGVEALTITPFYVLLSIVWALNGWCWVIAILSFGQRRLNFNHVWLQLSNELVLPFYVLHQTVIVMMAFYVVGMNLNVIFKYLIIVSSSFAIIGMLLVPIRKINVLRFLFGMRLNR